MIISLSIKNFLLIESEHVIFESGFNVITGESGSGKSLIFKAIRFCFGGRLDRSYIGKWSDKLIVTMKYKLSNQMKLSLSHIGFPISDEIEIVHSMHQDQRVCHINGFRVKQSDLKEMTGLMLLDSQQSQQVKLGDPIVQRDIIDQLLSPSQLTDYQKQYQQYQSLSSQLSDSQILLNQQVDIEWLEYQIKELSELDCQPEKIAELQDVIEAHKRFQDLWNIWQKDEIHYQHVHSSIMRLQQLLPIEQHQELHEYFEQALISNQELVARLSTHIEEISDQSKLAHANETISQLKTVARKHRIPIENLGDYLNELEDKYAKIINAQNQLEQLEEATENAHLQVRSAAQSLHNIRLKHSTSFIQRVSGQLLLLGLDQAELMISWEEQPLDGYGQWTPVILIKSNPGQPFKPLDQCLSGGELSRLNLLFTVNHQKDQVLMLDEVDTGISGTMGSMVRSMLLDLSESTQVMCISHIVPVAKGGHAHFKVSKRIVEAHAVAHIKRLDDTERQLELDRMGCIDEVIINM